MTLLGSIHYDLAWIVVGILTLCAFMPILIALFFTLWIATRPSGEQP
jgi:lauroyl/myristoyl acyltransferase